MGFKRLLTVGLMALFCAGTATAASQLNSVQVTKTANAATVNLQTNGSYAHKEYRPDEHLVLVDLTGVTANPAVERAVALNSAVLKGYKLSSYTSASGSEVTRIELELGDGVTLEVIDRSDGLQILLSGSRATAPAPAPASSVATPFPSVVAASTFAAPSPSVPAASTAAAPSPSAPAASTAATPIPALVETASRPAPEIATPVVKNAETPRAVVSLARPAGHSPLRPVIPAAASNALTPTTIRSISVRRGHGTLDVIIAGPNSAHPFLLKNPDRLVVDFSNAVVRPSIRNIAVHTKDVLQVRVGRFQSEPPITRVVIDLSGPRVFDIVASAQQVIVRIKTEDAAIVPAPLKAAPAPVLASAEAPAMGPAKPMVLQVKTEDAAIVPPPLKAAPAPVLASAEAPAMGPAKPMALQVKTEDAAIVPPPLKAAPAPVLASAEAPAVAGRNPDGNSNGTHAEVLSAASAPPADVAMLAASSTLRLREQQVSDPKARAGSAADTVAASPMSSQPVVMEQFPGNATATSPSTPKYTGEPISVNLKDVDLKDFFRLIHEISGLNIVLDPNVKGTLTLVLDDVPWDQALDIVLKNNGLDRELQGNVLRIAATDTLRKEAVDRRAQSEAVALAVDRQTITRFLSYAKAKEVVPTIKKFLTARGDVISDERTNALIISDIPSVLPNLDRLISQLDKKSQEVEIEVRVVSASRSFSRDLGFQLGFNWGNGVSTIGGLSSGTSGTSTTTSTTTTTNTNPANIPLFSNFPATGATTGLSFSNITPTYGIDAILTAAENHGLAKILSRPRVLTQSNVKAEVKQGLKIPVYTAGTSNANSSVSYIDAVLRLSVTPQITADNTIFLTVDVENTQPEGAPLGNGNFELSTQQTTTQVLVSDGATVVIGGVIQTTNTVNTSQTPVLGSIPWLGNLFKERSVSTSTNELIFFITPKIIQT